jgi:H+/Cl- antiporter ClcA
MKYSNADWAEKRKRGLARYLLIDGILITGGPFAVVMQVVGYFLLADASQSFGQYFSSMRTWLTFLLHGILFGLIVGYINWRRNEKAFAGKNIDEQK